MAYKWFSKNIPVEGERYTCNKGEKGFDAYFNPIDGLKEGSLKTMVCYEVQMGGEVLHADSHKVVSTSMYVGRPLHVNGMACAAIASCALEAKKEIHHDTLAVAGDEEGAIAKSGVAKTGDNGVAITNEPGISISGSHSASVGSGDGISITKDYGIATSGIHGLAMAKEYGLAQSGTYGISITGMSGMADAGNHGVSIGQGCSVVSANDSGLAASGNYGVAKAGHSGVAIAKTEGLSEAGTCGVAISADYGKAEAGAFGLAVSGKKGHAKAKTCGIAISGKSGHACAEKKGIAISQGESECGAFGIAIAQGMEPKAKGGIGAFLILKLTDSHGHVLASNMAAVDGEPIRPDVWYTLSQDGQFVEATALAGQEGDNNGNS